MIIVIIIILIINNNHHSHPSHHHPLLPAPSLVLKETAARTATCAVRPAFVHLPSIKLPKWQDESSAPSAITLPDFSDLAVLSVMVHRMLIGTLSQWPLHSVNFLRIFCIEAANQGMGRRILVAGLHWTMQPQSQSRYIHKLQGYHYPMYTVLILCNIFIYRVQYHAQLLVINLYYSAFATFCNDFSQHQQLSYQAGW